ncbi:hypothetical protein BD779DRAFT_1497062 [Infundibulicybe gibba]|nr:hypothetical protein BD779DRAFT_1497062 [Infundibulicybe gibba]
MESPILSQQVFESLALSNSSSSSSSSNSSASTDITPPLSPVKEEYTLEFPWSLPCSPGLLAKSSPLDSNSTPKIKSIPGHAFVPLVNQDAGYDSDRESWRRSIWSMLPKVAKKKRALHSNSGKASHPDIFATPTMPSFNQRPDMQAPRLTAGAPIGLGLGPICVSQVIEIQQTPLPERSTTPAVTSPMCPAKPRLRPLISPDSPSPILPLPCLQNNGTILAMTPPAKPLLMPTVLPEVISPIEELPALAMDISLGWCSSFADARKLPDNLRGAEWTSPDPTVTPTNTSTGDIAHLSPTTVHANQGFAPSDGMPHIYTPRVSLNHNDVGPDDSVDVLLFPGVHRPEYLVNESARHSALDSAVLEVAHSSLKGRKAPAGLGLGMPSSLQISASSKRGLRASVHTHPGLAKLKMAPLRQTCHEALVSGKRPQEYPKWHLYDIHETTPLLDVSTESVISRKLCTLF